MATTTASSDGEDWLKMKQLIFKDDKYLEVLSRENLVLFLIGVDLNGILDGQKDRDFHLLLTLAHGKRKMSELSTDLIASLGTSLKASLKNGDKIDENTSVLKIDAAGSSVHLHLYSLLHPDAAADGKMNVSSKVFVNSDAEHPETSFLSSNDSSKPAAELDFCFPYSKEGESVDGLIVQLPSGACPDSDRNRLWVFKK
ncbi:uncharacterized protein CTRU02_212506 [Colletotrichum truncatum]|uniref:Uncharacterized protein n=2 Tax=Colletotrichum truncatum TaxID=5467 RepID=A0ACC3YNQ6_COLTU|nr:uncharacterized protein CTRU02_13551 [Colletotrichum truncatum]XP_036584605.1 uncharacterized protein CTRU02_05680 [Colletotrichum truncatum]KAF6783315.1 hypothetical protein CTRU02_13551 [Colletotrichum truncatum]KAF6794123.1 hypothetical protein CTRU02_05680 [Colletotrichum truncatum]